MPSPLLASLENIPWVAIIAVGGSMVMTIVVIIGGLITAHHRQKLWHDTARLALEKGQPLPGREEETAPPRPQTDGTGRDLRTGLILVACGLSLYLFLGALLGPALALIGAIPGFIGVALLLFGCLSLLFKRKDSPPASRL